MKLVRYGERGHEKPGLVHSDGTIRDISGVIPDLAGEHLSAASLRRVADAARGDLPKASGNPRLGPCVARPGNFIAVGLNYADHAPRSRLPDPGGADPLQQGAELHLSGRTTTSSSRAARRRPIGRSSSPSSSASARAMSTRSEALDHVAGYCVCNDVSEREYQIERGGQWMKGKGCPTFGPLGPWLVTPDEIADVQNLDMWLDVNGQRMQTGSTKTMIFGVRADRLLHLALHDPRCPATSSPPARRPASASA